jgi:DNA mismatch repair protein MutS
MADQTPMMQQYHEIKAHHRDAILFFRLGDFYEMFYQDAQEASKILSLTLTKRNGVPMCGIPYHASQNYTSRLLAAGKKIAVCEQTQLPVGGKGIAKREVVEILTPGTILEESMLDQTSNNFLVSLSLVDESKDIWAIAALDVSTGELSAIAFTSKDPVSQIRSELFKYKPREMVVPESLLHQLPNLVAHVSSNSSVTLNRYPDWYFDKQAGYRELTRILGVTSLRAYGISESSAVLYPISGLLTYSFDTIKQNLDHLRLVMIQQETPQGLAMDESTLKNLEILANLQDGSQSYTLLETVHFTQTPMGTRLLKQWLLRPLTDVHQIKWRLWFVSYLYKHQNILRNISEGLTNIRDLERLSSRVATEKAHAKDLSILGRSLAQGLEVISLINEPNPLDTQQLSLVQGINKDEISRIEWLIQDTLIDNPSVVFHEGNLIRSGLDNQVDRFRTLQTNSKALLQQYLEEQRSLTGISNLKLKYNRIIGYHFEVSKGQIQKTPDHFIRRQSLVNGERYTTEELGRLEQEIHSAAQLLIERERELFLALRLEVKTVIPLILQLSRTLATIDCLQSFASAATDHGWTEPEITEEPELVIERGRHPVVELHLPVGAFVPNSLNLGISTPRSESKNPTSNFVKDVSTALITGPNMAGKSTYLRQNALLVILAQCGSFVPADFARIGICDSLFCRVGANDNLARGESTFLVEMIETAFILQTATPQSFIIMDEVGRGTSTHDGLSIAQSVLEYLLSKVQARTLFATHYHELTFLDHPNLQKLTLEVKEEKGSVVFLKRVIPGSASSSYGVHVAKLAGIPGEVINRAFALLKLHQDQLTQAQDLITQIGQGNPPSDNEPFQYREQRQPELFDPQEQVLLELKNLDLETTTPLQALVIVSRWKSQVES